METWKQWIKTWKHAGYVLCFFEEKRKMWDEICKELFMSWIYQEFYKKYSLKLKLRTGDNCMFRRSICWGP